MKLLIEISDREYLLIKNSDRSSFADFSSKECMMYAIRNGTPYEERPQGELNKKHTCDSCIHYGVCEYAVYRSEIICDDHIADMRGSDNG